MVEWISRRATVTWLRDRRDTKEKYQSTGETITASSASERNWRTSLGKLKAPRDSRLRPLRGATPNTQTANAYADESLGNTRRAYALQIAVSVNHTFGWPTGRDALSESPKYQNRGTYNCLRFNCVFDICFDIWGDTKNGLSIWLKLRSLMLFLLKWLKRKFWTVKTSMK